MVRGMGFERTNPCETKTSTSSYQWCKVFKKSPIDYDKDLIIPEILKYAYLPEQTVPSRQDGLHAGPVLFLRLAAID